MTAHREGVRLLVAARNRDRAREVAQGMGLQTGEWRLLDYATHRAFPTTRLYVDVTWASAPNPAGLEVLIGRRIAMAVGVGGSTLGAGSRQTVARTGE